MNMYKTFSGRPWGKLAAITASTRQFTSSSINWSSSWHRKLRDAISERSVDGRIAEVLQKRKSLSAKVSDRSGYIQEVPDWPIAKSQTGSDAHITWPQVLQKLNKLSQEVQVRLGSILFQEVPDKPTAKSMQRIHELIIRSNSSFECRLKKKYEHFKF